MTDEGRIARIAYSEAAATPFMRSVPRFGASDSFANIFGTKEESTDYIVGLLFAGLFLFSFYFLWTLLIFLFKCLGQRRVGFLSGTAFAKSTNARTFTRPFLSRLVFLNAALMFVVFSVLFVTQGITNLRTTVTTVLESARNVDTVMSDLDLLVSDIKVSGTAVSQSSRNFEVQLASNRLDCLMENDVQAETGTDFAELIAAIADALIAFGPWVPEGTDELQNTTMYIQDHATGVDEDVSNVELSDWQSLLVIIPYIIIPSFLMVGVCAAWFEVDIPIMRCLLSWLILPIFIVQVIFSYSFSAAILIAASANADFCSGGVTQTPDGTVSEILIKEGYTEDDMKYQIVTWYVGQCAAAAKDPFHFLELYQGKLEALHADILSFATALDQARQAVTLSATCSAQVAALTALTRTLTTDLQHVVDTVTEALALMQCSSIVSLYTKPVYDGTCTYSITGITWAWASFAVVACRGLIMIMLRSSWQLDVQYGNNSSTALKNVVAIGAKGSNDYPDDIDEYGGYTGYNAAAAAAADHFQDEEGNLKRKDQEQPFGGGGYGQLGNDDDYMSSSSSGEEYGRTSIFDGGPSRMESLN